MGQLLPHSDFIKLNDPVKLKAFEDKLKAGEKPNITGRGYICEVDIQVPRELWPYLDEFPPCPTSRTVSPQELSGVQREQYVRAYNKAPPQNGGTAKLVADFHVKKKYVVHHKYLEFLLKIGVFILCLHAVMTFVERAFMKEWMEFCTTSRAAARVRKDENESNFFKLCANACYGVSK